jgi:catechol 2,3-dioxygenase-like lactoylglutathione lyase family enzyme
VLQAPRWTHVALPVADLAASIEWYQRFTPLRSIDQRADEAGEAAWLTHPEPTDRPFVLVLVMFNDRKGKPQPQLAPFAHLGIELTSKADVEQVAQRGREEGCLAWEPQQLPPPVGFICAVNDPDGNVVEFSFDQGVASKVAEVFGPATTSRT